MFNFSNFAGQFVTVTFVRMEHSHGQILIGLAII